MAGSIVVSTSDNGSRITKYNILWTTDVTGNVDAVTFQMKAGTIISVEFIPGTGGSQPTDLYDVDAKDEHGVSIFDNGAGTSIGSNLSSTLATHAIPLLGVAGITVFRRWHQGGTIEVEVESAGASKSGTITIYVVDGVL